MISLGMNFTGVYVFVFEPCGPEWTWFGLGCSHLTLQWKNTFALTPLQGSIRITRIHFHLKLHSWKNNFFYSHSFDTSKMFHCKQGFIRFTPRFLFLVQIYFRTTQLKSLTLKWKTNMSKRQIEFLYLHAFIFTIHYVLSIVWGTVKHQHFFPPKCFPAKHVFPPELLSAEIFSR